MKIGIPAYEKGGMYGVESSYMEFAEIFGTPVVLTTGSALTTNIDGLILPGGADVNPSRYGVPGFKTGNSNVHLEYFDTQVFPEILARKIPIFGICRGLQMLNVHFGGNLIQHLFTHPYSGSELDLVHGVRTVEDATQLFEVNSFHHQACGNIGRGGEVLFISTDSEATIEAISWGKNIVAVQWHPERMMDEFSFKTCNKLFS